MIDARSVEGSRERAVDRGGNQFDMPDTSRPNMGDFAFVENRVRTMLSEVVDIRRRYLDENGSEKGSFDAMKAIEALVPKWSRTLSAANSEFVQTMTPEGQQAWLRSKGFGEPHGAHEAIEFGDGSPLAAFVASTIRDLVEAMTAHENGLLSDEDAQFRVQVTVENAVALLMGVENSADGEE